MKPYTAMLHSLHKRASFGQDWKVPAFKDPQSWKQFLQNRNIPYMEYEDFLRKKDELLKKYPQFKEKLSPFEQWSDLARSNQDYLRGLSRDQASYDAPQYWTDPNDPTKRQLVSQGAYGVENPSWFRRTLYKIKDSDYNPLNLFQSDNQAMRRGWRQYDRSRADAHRTFTDLYGKASHNLLHKEYNNYVDPQKQLERRRAAAWRQARQKHGIPIMTQSSEHSPRPL